MLRLHRRRLPLLAAATRCATPCKKEVAESGMQNEVQVKGVGCMGLCSAGPLVASGDRRQDVRQRHARRRARDHPQPGYRRRRRLRECPTDVPFFQRQKKIVLENSGRIDPERIEDYIANDGYLALVNAIAEMTPQEVIDEIMRSGLRGRGGAGYPTGLKWSTVAKTGEQEKYVICNADEGDPGAFMDRACWKAIRTACWKAWPSPPTPWARRRASSTSAPSIRWRSSI